MSSHNHISGVPILYDSGRCNNQRIISFPSITDSAIGGQTSNIESHQEGISKRPNDKLMIKIDQSSNFSIKMVKATNLNLVRKENIECSNWDQMEAPKQEEGIEF